MSTAISVIIMWLITGLVIGGLAHLLVPGRNRIGIIRTLLFGIAGALVGGFVTAALLGPGHVIITFIVALIVAALLIVAVSHPRFRRRYSGRYSRRRWARRRRLVRARRAACGALDASVPMSPGAPETRGIVTVEDHWPESTWRPLPGPPRPWWPGAPPEIGRKMLQEAVDDLIGLHDAVLRNETVEGFLGELARLAARVVPDGGSCGMTLSQQGRKPATVACSDPLATQVDQVQYRDGDGPCLTAMREGQVVRVDSMAGDSRWPAFGKRAASMGVRSSLSLPLLADGTPTGALNVYAPHEAAFGPQQVRRAERLASIGSGALTVVLRLASVIARNQQLRASLESRALIDQAMGVIMAVRRCTPDQALAILRTASQNQNVKLRDLAADIVAQASGEQPGPPNPFQLD